MASSTDIGPPPDGIVLLQGSRPGYTYVVNELLNYYQRKASLLNGAQMALLPHHEFSIEKFESAKATLLALWQWKKLTPSSTNHYIIRNLEPRRMNGNIKPKIAEDIMKFLEVEDGNLSITFLTLNCEEIPSIVHESMAMKDVYVLMHQSQQNYNTVLDIVKHREEEMENQAKLIDSLQTEMRCNFQTILARLDRRESPNNPIVIADNTPVMSESGDNASLPEGIDHLISTVRQNLSTLVVDITDEWGDEEGEIERVSHLVEGSIVRRVEVEASSSDTDESNISNNDTSSSTENTHIGHVDNSMPTLLSEAPLSPGRQPASATDSAPAVAAATAEAITSSASTAVAATATEASVTPAAVAATVTHSVEAAAAVVVPETVGQWPTLSLSQQQQRRQQQLLQQQQQQQQQQHLQLQQQQ